jgi:NAD(P)H-dependent FMN reductase
MSKLRIATILASVREGRRGEPIARWIHGLATARADLDVELLDLREWPLPEYRYPGMARQAEKTYTDPTAKRWVETIGSKDGFVIVTPEYNHGYPAPLKNAIDHVFMGWARKPVAFVSYGGFAGGARAVEQLRLVMAELKMAPVRDEVNLSLVHKPFDAEGKLTNPIFEARANTMLDELTWWARTLAEGRAGSPLSDA